MPSLPSRDKYTERKMVKIGPIFLILLFTICLTIPSMVRSITTEEHRKVDQWLQNLHHAKQKLTHLHFYFHDNVFGPDPTSLTVAVADNTTLKSSTYFGQVNIFDNLLTKGPEVTSKLLGRAQGLYAFSSLEKVSLVMALNFVFTSGKYNGSTLTVLGRNQVEDSVRELPIIGGTGVFRLARGFALAKTYLFSTSVAIIEYNVTALHY